MISLRKAGAVPRVRGLAGGADLLSWFAGVAAGDAQLASAPLDHLPDRPDGFQPRRLPGRSPPRKVRTCSVTGGLFKHLGAL
jgi:hypothetical protein